LHPGKTLAQLERYQSLLAPAERSSLVDALSRPLLPALRVNTLKADPVRDVQLWADWYDWELRPVPFCSTGWQVVTTESALSATVEHRMSHYYIQDAASMLPVELFDLTGVPFPLVLDMAASPGGKTTHLLSAIGDRGLLVSNDSSRGRLAALSANVQGWGAASVVITNYPGERFGSWLPETFDYILLDAPCSGDSLRAAKRRRSRTMDESRRESFHERQVRLIESAFQAVKPGGQLVYSTCSLAPEEDEAVVDALLRITGGTAVVESVGEMLPVSAPGIDSYEGVEFLPEVRRAVRLWPHLYDTSGFFAALISKKAASPGESFEAPYWSLETAGYEKQTSEECSSLFEGFLQDYGVDLECILRDHQLAILRRDSAVYAVPELYLSRLGTLPCVSLGLELGQYHGESFVPSHELVSRFWPQFVRQRLQVDSDLARIWLAGRDLRGPAVAANGIGPVVLLEDERNRFLGCGKIQDRRIRNLMPRRLVR
jgi:16S rRNA (cytosine1407-C5)-methyltransferase